MSSSHGVASVSPTTSLSRTDQNSKNTIIDRIKPSTRKPLAGAISGMLSALAFQPLDVIRTHQQGAFGSITTNKQKKHSLIQSIIADSSPKTGGINNYSRIRALWRGTSPTLIRVGGGAGLYFTILEYCMDKLPASSMNTFISGAFARTFAGAVMFPLTVVKARMEWLAPGTYASSRHAFQLVLKEEGVRGLYRGLVPTLVRDVPFSGLYVLIYKRLKVILESKLPQVPSYGVNFSSGVCAGILATTLVHPADVVKTRMQLHIMQNTSQTQKKNVLTLSETVLKILREEGGGGFVKGIIPRVLKRTLSTALTWTIYEHLSISKA
jgi:solute carrier family 25 protein 38